MDRVDEQPTHQAAGGDPVNDPVLGCRGLSKTFGATPALRGVELDVAAGEVVAVMGPSGSGKSTLLHCLAGILLPDGGEVEFDGDRVDRMSEARRSELRRRAFGFVFQFGQLIPELPAVENAALPLLLSGVVRREATARARRWLERLGVDEVADRLPANMSGGQAQRVALARGLVIEPRVVFADEPTGSLDSLAGEQVMELLVGAARDEGASVLVITHEPRVAAYADREVVLRDGRTIAPVTAS